MHMHLLLFTTLCPPIFWFAHSICLRQCCQVRGPRSKSRPGQEFGSIFLLRTLLRFWDHKPHLSGYIYTRVSPKPGTRLVRKRASSERVQNANTSVAKKTTRKKSDDTFRWAEKEGRKT